MLVEEPIKKTSSVDIARQVLEKEANALSEVANRLDDSIQHAAEIIHNHGGKIVICGIGKSGHVAQKIASTLSSTGTPAIFLHPGEAVHGDLGVYNPGDPSILISKSGSTAELLKLIPTLRQFESPIISIVSNTQSPIALKSDVVLDATVTCEADPLGIVPTSSALVAMAMGDALAAVLMQMKNFQKNDFAKLHPAGQLGRNLTFTVQEVMQRVDRIAVVAPEAKLLEVVVAMTDAPQGAACVVDSQNNLLGIITDGDVRRFLVEVEDIKKVTAGEVMTNKPIKAVTSMSLASAVKLMEDRPSQISVLPVTEEDGDKLVGLLRLHDVYQPHIS